MNVLGIDTSTPATAVCVLRSDGRSFESVPDRVALLGPPAHARDLLPAVAELMDAAGLGFGELDAIAAGVGPGGYTGLRIGIATARSLARASDLPVRPVGSLAALAAGMDATVALPLIDARRGEIFAALYVHGDQRWEPFVTRPEALLDRLAADPEARPETPLAAGGGSLRFRHALEAASIEVAPDGSRLHVVRALQVCRLAAHAPAVAPEAVSPEYLRAPDATPRR